MNWRKEQRSRRHGDLRWLEVRGELLSKSVMQQGVLGNSLTATSWRGFYFFYVSGLHGYRTLSLPYCMLILKCTRVLLYVVQ